MAKTFNIYFHDRETACDIIITSLKFHDLITVSSAIVIDCSAGDTVLKKFVSSSNELILDSNIHEKKHSFETVQNELIIDAPSVAYTLQFFNEPETNSIEFVDAISDVVCYDYIQQEEADMLVLHSTIDESSYKVLYEISEEIITDSEVLETKQSFETFVEELILDSMCDASLIGYMDPEESGVVIDSSELPGVLREYRHLYQMDEFTLDYYDLMTLDDITYIEI